MLSFCKLSFWEAYSTTPKCLTTLNVFTYFWHKCLAAKHKNSSVKLITSCHIWRKSDSYKSWHTGMFTFNHLIDSQIPVPKVCEKIKSGHTFGCSPHNMSFLITLYCRMYHCYNHSHEWWQLCYIFIETLCLQSSRLP
jgi:hypothetical protein